MLTSPTNQVTEEEAELLESLEDEAANSKITLSFLLQLGDGCLGTAAVLRCLEMEDGGLVHLETRQPRHDKVRGGHTRPLVELQTKVQISQSRRRPLLC